MIANTLVSKPPITNHQSRITVLGTNHEPCLPRPARGERVGVRGGFLPLPLWERAGVRGCSLLLPLLFLFLTATNATAAFRSTLYYPYVEMSAPGGIDITFLFSARKDAASCETLATSVTNGMLAVCLTCQIKAKQCLDSLDPQHRKMLSADPLDVPSARLPDGVSTYHASDPAIALAACRESERLTSSRAEPGRIVCYPPKTVRPLPAPRKAVLDSSHYILGLLFFLLSGIASGFACYLIVRYKHLHAHLTDDSSSGPQKFHAVPTPRIGGLAILIGLLVAGAGLLPMQERFSVEDYGYLLLATLPAFAGGIVEDIIKTLAVLPRLLLSMLAAGICAWLLGAVLTRLDIPGVDPLLLWPPLAVAFTVFAVSGVTNAINIIDGYNGLAGGYAVMVLAALALVAAQVGDAFLLTSALAMIGALLSFLIWNYPKGKMFLGDGGAYLLGFWLAEISVLLVVRHPEVSPWFPPLLLAYPILEALFSIYRKKIMRGLSPGQPDALNLFQLIYLRLVRVFVGSRDSILRTRRNAIVAGYIWIMAAIFCIFPALFFWQQSAWLAGCILIFCTWYFWLFRSMALWHSPKWLIRTSPRLFTRHS